MVKNSLQVTTQKVPRHMVLEIQVLAWDRYRNVAGLDKLVNGISNRYKQTIQTCTGSLPLKKSTYYHNNECHHEHVVVFPAFVCTLI